MSTRIFGHIPGIPVGKTYTSYADLNLDKIHRPSQGGISGSANEGADSVVISGGYKDDLDFGDEIIYTGQGGRNLSGKHVKDQTLTRMNLALAKNELEGLPVRVIRGQDKKNPHAPQSGYRYDGLFRVEDHWHEPGQGGFKVWRYRLRKIAEDQQHAPPPQPTPPLGGGNPTPGRIATTVQRIVRDTRTAKSVKSLHGHQCQICGIKIVTAAGPYAEAAHIQPLGAPHNGPDTADNILCLCPNHHVMFDLGAFSIADDLTLIGIEGKLNTLPGHPLNLSCIAYHRDHYFERTVEA